MIFAVDKYIDKIIEKESRALSPHYEFFNTIEEAKRFLVTRAENRVYRAEDNLRAERNRLTRCYKKYGGKK